MKDNTTTTKEEAQPERKLSGDEIQSKRTENDVVKTTKRVRRQATPEQLANPFHGVKLKQVFRKVG